MPKISIIVPVFNVQNYLSFCINSILNQTFADFELILVIDGSPDLSSEICDEFARIDSRIIIINKMNAGVSKTRNDGVILSNGQYITFIDSDDWVDLHFLEVLYRAIQQKKSCDMAVCEAKRTEKYFEHLEEENNDQFVLSNREAIEYYAKLDIQYQSNTYRSPCAKLIKRKIVLKHPFPVGRSYAEDAACVYLWMWDSACISCIDNQLYCYYQNPNSACHSMLAINYLESLQTEKEWIEFYEKNDFEELLRAAVDNYIINCYWTFQRFKQLQDIESARKFSTLMFQALKEYKSITSYTLRKNSDLYLVYFPKLNVLYKHLLATENMLKQHGLKAVVNRLFAGNKVE